jgi:hypothetical protein
MPSGPIEEAIKGLLAEATVATAKRDWVTVSSLARAALKLDPENADALELKSVAVNNGVSIKALLLDSAAATAKMDWNRVSSIANTILELEPDNIDALKFKSLSSDHLNPKTISEKVQQALAANEQAKAEALIRVHLTENPDDQEGLKAQHVVLEARQKQRVQQAASRNRICSNCRSNLNHSPYCPSCGQENSNQSLSSRSNINTKGGENGSQLTGMQKAIYFVVIGFIVLGIYSCFSSNSSNSPSVTENKSSGSGQSASSSNSPKWFEGGTLHNATIAKWKSGTYQNKLATSSDWLSATVWKGSLNSPSDFDKLKAQAQSLVAAVNAVVTVEKTDSLKVGEIAVSIITISNEFGP